MGTQDGPMVGTGDWAAELRSWTAVPLKGHRAAVHCVAWDATGTRLATGGEDGSVMTWAWRANKTGAPSTSTELRGHLACVRALDYRPVVEDAPALLSVSDDATLRIWEPRDPSPTAAAVRGQAVNARWSPDGQWACVGDKKDLLLFYSWAKAGIAMEKQYTVEVNEFVWNHDSTLLFVSLSTGMVEVLHFPSLDHFDYIKGHAGTVYALDYNLTTKQLIIGAADAVASLWHTERGEFWCERGFNAPGQFPYRSLSFAPEGDVLALGSHAKSIELVRVTTGEQLHVIPSQGAANCVRWSPSTKHRRLAITSDAPRQRNQQNAGLLVIAPRAGSSP